MKLVIHERPEEIPPFQAVILYNHKGEEVEVIADWITGGYMKKRCLLPPQGSGIIHNNTYKKKVLYLPEGVSIEKIQEKEELPLQEDTSWSHTKPPGIASNK